MNKEYKLLTTIASILLIFFCTNIFANTNDTLPNITLNGDNGELAGGGEWNSRLLENKVNLILYVDPDKQGDIKKLVSKLDSINFSQDLLNITFILNTKATIIPDFIIRSRVKKRAESVPGITYVLDFEKVLVKQWNLGDNDVNVLLLDSNGIIVEKHQGVMDCSYINSFIEKINHLVNKGEIK